MACYVGRLGAWKVFWQVGSDELIRTIFVSQRASEMSLGLLQQMKNRNSDFQSQPTPVEISICPSGNARVVMEGQFFTVEAFIFGQRKRICKKALCIILHQEVRLASSQSSCFVSTPECPKLREVALPWLDHAVTAGGVLYGLLSKPGYLNARTQKMASRFKAFSGAEYEAAVRAYFATLRTSGLICTDLKTLCKDQRVTPGCVPEENVYLLFRGLLRLVRETPEWPVDISPGNILVAKNAGEAVFINANRLEDKLYQTDKDLRAMQPIQLLDEETCSQEKAKAWGLACSLLWIFSGKQPFAGKTTRQIDAAIAGFDHKLELPEIEKQLAKQPVALKVVKEILELLAKAKAGDGDAITICALEAIANAEDPKDKLELSSDESDPEPSQRDVREVKEILSMARALEQCVSSLQQQVAEFSKMQEELATLKKENQTLAEAIEKLREERRQLSPISAATPANASLSEPSARSQELDAAASSGKMSATMPYTCDCKSRTLLEAARQRCFECAKHFIGEADIRDANGNTAMIVAAQHGLYRLVKLLKTELAGEQNNRGWTALHYAVQGHHLSIVKMLKTSEDGIRNAEGLTALDVAVRSNYRDAIKCLSEDPAADMLPPKAIDIQFDPPAAQQVILAKKCETTQSRPTACTCGKMSQNLLQAAKNNCTTCVKAHLSQAGTIDRYGNTALILAAELGFVEIVELLLPYEAGITNDADLTALGKALINKQNEAAKLLKREPREWQKMPISTQISLQPLLVAVK